MPPLAIACLRCAVAALVIVLIAPRAIARDLAAAGRPLVLVGAGALLAAHFGLFTAGLVATSLPAAVSLVALEPLAVVLVAWATLGVRPSHSEAIGVVVA